MTTRFADDETLAHIAKLERELAECQRTLAVAESTIEELSSLRTELAECQREIYTLRRNGAEMDAAWRRELTECQRERDEAQVDQLQWLTYRHVIDRVEDLEKENCWLLSALIEARKWIGDGENSDGLPREYWTNEYIDAVEMIDDALAKVGAGETGEES